MKTSERFDSLNAHFYPIKTFLFYSKKRCFTFIFLLDFFILKLKNKATILNDENHFYKPNSSSFHS
jgi:hypothetical protein